MGWDTTGKDVSSTLRDKDHAGARRDDQRMYRRINIHVEQQVVPVAGRQYRSRGFDRLRIRFVVQYHERSRSFELAREPIDFSRVIHNESCKSSAAKYGIIISNLYQAFVPVE